MLDEMPRIRYKYLAHPMTVFSMIIKRNFLINLIKINYLTHFQHKKKYLKVIQVEEKNVSNRNIQKRKFIQNIYDFHLR